VKIRIPLSRHAYTPEAYAYKEFLTDKGWQVQLDFEGMPDEPALDIRICFMGFRPFWGASKVSIPEVHEYHSLSTPPYASVKNLVKRCINRQPAGRIFLNKIVQKNLFFGDEIPTIYRDMGIDRRFFGVRQVNPEFDLIYSGTVRGRVGLVGELLRLAKLGLKILIAGEVDESTRKLFGALGHVTFTGRLQPHELPEVYGSARLGLNYTPDVYPFNCQTSTKTLEYCAAGLGVISNRYQWASKFAEQRGATFLWLDDLTSETDLNAFNFQVPDVSDLEWSTLLNAAGMEDFLRRCAA
jgi:hypothetical protein